MPTVCKDYSRGPAGKGLSKYFKLSGLLISVCNKKTLISQPKLIIDRVVMVREKILENFPGQGKVRKFHFQSGKFRKNEKSGKFNIFQKRC